ncbi:Arm DNA-binding domain-containing protein [Roseobacter sp. CCS2]|uniref:Arm DNA-binding domain-containing protein n=1 Tax=Roseobacter sp. CCS2 TaxID=391593 RepID=UPI0000F3C57E|nr:Arm DNA-binding domain-containing protein [Roseobacter sp. CCS2]EBA11898.1 phage integrase [Roseobacter sp. CCS2]
MITKDLQLKSLPKGNHKIMMGLQYKSNGDGTGSFQGRYTVGGDPVTMSLGTYPTIRLSEAKDAHTQHQLDAKKGLNPKKAVEAVVQANLSSGTTFADVLPLAYADIQRGWKNGGKGYGFMTKMDAIVIPAIGTMEIAEIRPKHLADMARPLWQDKYPTIDKALLFAGQVLQWAEKNDSDADGGAAQRFNLWHLQLTCWILCGGRKSAATARCSDCAIALRCRSLETIDCADANFPETKTASDAIAAELRVL